MKVQYDTNIFCDAEEQLCTDFLDSSFNKKKTKQIHKLFSRIYM